MRILQRLPAPFGAAGPPVTDDRIVFIMPVFRDADVAARALTRLRRTYPASRVVLISDGDADFPGTAFALRFGIEYEFGENLYAIGHGGRMVHRLLEAYMRAPAAVMVRLDSDARIDRRFAWLPTKPGLYGTIGRRSGTVQGGCILFTHEAAARLHHEETFLSEALLDPASSWGRYSSPENLARKLAQRRIAYDKVLHWGCVAAGVPVRPFPEIFSVWKPEGQEARLANRRGRYAIVHPDKMEGAPS